ncbi:MAG: 7,8-didemethyl-8-hydroxy-5-deazariboflavin synthase, partial [Mesorhizobium sp.]|nr:7,8-didemethyl-8-hydroxy-5-deazariboflavin synthase [Mesorhizobium sp.]
MNRLSFEEAVRIGSKLPIKELAALASETCAAAHGHTVTYSPKVFIPLTQLCRDVCHYCTFAKAPRNLKQPYLSIDEVLDVAKAGAKAGCTEALFTLGDKPELRYNSAAKALETMGYLTTLDYVRAAAEIVLKETGLLPHINAG